MKTKGTYAESYKYFLQILNTMIVYSSWGFIFLFMYGIPFIKSHVTYSMFTFVTAQACLRSSTYWDTDTDTDTDTAHITSKIFKTKVWKISVKVWRIRNHANLRNQIRVRIMNWIWKRVHVNSNPGGYQKVHGVAATSLKSLLCGSQSGNCHPK